MSVCVGSIHFCPPWASDHRLKAAYRASLPQTHMGCSRGSVWASWAPPTVRSTIHSQSLIAQLPFLFFYTPQSLIIQLPLLSLYPLPVTRYPTPILSFPILLPKFPSPIPPNTRDFTDLLLAIMTNKTATTTSNSTTTQRKQNNSNHNNDNT